MRVLLVLGCFAAVLLPANAEALPVTFDFSGFVTRTKLAEVNVGESFQGSFTFDSNATASQYSPEWWSFRSLTAETSLNIMFAGGYSTSLQSEASVHVVHRPEIGSSYESWGVAFSGFPNSHSYMVIDFVTYSGGRLLQTGVLPLSPPDALHYEYERRLNIDYGDVVGVVDSVTSASVIPEPASAIMMGIGLAALSRLKRGT